MIPLGLLTERPPLLIIEGKDQGLGGGEEW